MQDKEIAESLIWVHDHIYLSCEMAFMSSVDVRRAEALGVEPEQNIVPGHLNLTRYMVDCVSQVNDDQCTVEMSNGNQYTLCLRQEDFLDIYATALATYRAERQKAMSAGEEEGTLVVHSS